MTPKDLKNLAELLAPLIAERLPDLMAGPTPVASKLPERFRSKISEAGVGCWLWTARCNAKGYGVYSVKARPVLAHRFAYELLVGPIPERLQIDHLCRNRHCVNPAHLEAVTCRENLLRGNTIAALLLDNPEAARKLGKGEL